MSRRRFILPVVLSLVNLVLIGQWLTVLSPDLAANKNQLRSLGAAITSLRHQMDADALILETIDADVRIFTALLGRGMIDPQDRLAATRLLDRLRESHGLSWIQYELAPETLFEDRDARAAGYAIVSTRITIQMSGLYDSDLLNFAQAVIDEIPGHVRPLTFSLKRINAANEENLDSLRQGQTLDFISGEMTFEWNTLRPIDRQAKL